MLEVNNNNTTMTDLVFFSLLNGGDQFQIEFGEEGNAIKLDLPSENDTKAVKQILNDPNFWTSFLGAFSNAVDMAKENMTNNGKQ